MGGVGIGRGALLGALAALAACREGAPPVSAVPGFVERVAAAREALPAGRPALLVLLHGIGADEDDLFPLAGRVDPRFTVVSLGAPHGYHGGRAWFHIDFAFGGRVVPDVAQARATLARLVAWLEAAPARHGTDPSHTFLLGFSQGAMMALGVLLEAPQPLAGVVALSGREPTGLFPRRAAREAIARVPLLVAHGTRDDVLPVAEGRRTRETFAGLSRDLTYREFDVGHGLAEDEVRLVAGWLAARLPARGPARRAD
jgi:phospholipase/carboxylesterase